MKKLATYLLVIFISAALAAFTTKYTIEKKNADQEIILGMLYQQSAAEYKALCLQAYNVARARVDMAVKSGRKNLAIISDLDETALDNSEAEAFSYVNDIKYDFPQLHKWWLFGKAKAMPGAVEFFQYAHAQGLAIYYISNRPADNDVVASTMANMHALGFPCTDAENKDHFLFLPDGAQPTKEPRRRKVCDTLKKDVVLLLGDNLIDINAAFDKIDTKYQSMEERKTLVDNFRELWGAKYIVFPNAYYGDWEACLYNNVPNLTNDQIQAARQQLLKTIDYTGAGH